MSDSNAAFDADPALEAALLLHEAGRLEEAKQAYLHILSLRPGYADALHLLGVVAHQTGDHLAAVTHIQQAIELKPGQATYSNNLGSALRALGRRQESIAAFQTCLLFDPDYAHAHFNLGVALIDQQDWEDALKCFTRAIELNPHFADAHYNQAITLRRLGRADGALSAFHEVARLQPDNGLAQHYIALLAGITSERAPDQYIASMFDGSADTFDQHLLQELHYDTPRRLLEILMQFASPAGKSWAVLDLGCGTGLVGAAIAPHACRLTGVDLSPKMLEQARRRGIYQRLEQSELLAMMEQEASASYDVITSADVFIYIGKLDGVFLQAQRLLRPGGYFAFSAESLDALMQDGTTAAEDYRLNPSGRYAHACAYLRRLAAGYGFAVQTMINAPARLEAGQPVPAWLVLCQVN